MNKQMHNRSSGFARAAAGALALAAIVALGAPQNAAASTTAAAKLLNVVTVNYKDASGNNPFSATASTTVTVTLVKAALTPSAFPGLTDGPWGLSCPGTASPYVSGSTVSTLYALYANANGTDTYNMSIADTLHSATLNSIHYKVLDYTGVAVATDPATHVLGSAIPVGFSGADTLQFPGGSLAASGFAVNDIVVVSYGSGATKKAYLVASIHNGHAASETHGDGTSGYTTPGALTGEDQDLLVLQAFPTQTILGQRVGANVAPAFGTTAPDLGVPVGEMALVQIDVNASAVTLNTDATVDYTLTADYTGQSLDTTITCTAGSWKAPNLSITKKVRNVTTNTPADFTGVSGTASGAPSDILEYQITVQNPGGTASSVVVTDAVPAYTHLVAGSAYGTYGAGNPTDIFAQADKNGAGTVGLTVQNSDVEGTDIAAGDAAGIIATKALTFFIGTGAANNAGGAVAAPDVYHIYYRVKID